MSIHVEYTDGTEETYPDVDTAEKGIVETVCGCDFAAQVQNVEEVDEDEDEVIPLYCSWKVELLGESGLIQKVAKKI